MNKLSKVATTASLIKKATKAQAFASLLKVINGHHSDHDLTELYSFFIPSLPKKPKTLEQWVGQACGKKDARSALNNMYSDGEWLYGCDGTIARRMKTTLEEGYYDIALNRLDIDLKYPDVKGLFERKNILIDVDLSECERTVTSFGTHAYRIDDHTYDATLVDGTIRNPSTSSPVFSIDENKSLLIHFMDDSESQAIVARCKR